MRPKKSPASFGGEPTGQFNHVTEETGLGGVQTRINAWSWMSVANRGRLKGNFVAAFILWVTNFERPQGLE